MYIRSMYKITKEDEAAYWRWMKSPDMKLTEAFAAYRYELLGLEDTPEDFDEYLEKNYD